MPHQAKLPEENVAEHASPANDPTVINLAEPAIDFDDDARPARTPLRFGRLALWMASATALGIGVLGTVAYGMWFNHDQRVYAEAMASARRTLGIDQPVIAERTESSGIVEAPVTSSPVTTSPLTTPAPVYASRYAPADGTASADTAALVDNPPAADAADETTLAGTSDAGGAAGATGAMDSAGTIGTAGAAMTTAAAASTQVQAQSRQADDAPAAAPARSAAAQRRASASAAQQTASTRNKPAAQARLRQARAKQDSGLFARVNAFFHRVSYRHNVPNRQREEYSRP